jgi:hypothetical protein
MRKNRGRLANTDLRVSTGSKVWNRDRFPKQMTRKMAEGSLPCPSEITVKQMLATMTKEMR